MHIGDGQQFDMHALVIGLQYWKCFGDSLHKCAACIARWTAVACQQRSKVIDAFPKLQPLLALSIAAYYDSFAQLAAGPMRWISQLCPRPRGY